MTSGAFLEHVVFDSIHERLPNFSGALLDCRSHLAADQIKRFEIIQMADRDTAVVRAGRERMESSRGKSWIVEYAPVQRWVGKNAGGHP